MVSLCDATQLSRWSEILPLTTARTTAASGGTHAGSAPQGEMKSPQGERRFSTRGNGNSTRGRGLHHQGRRSTRAASVERRAERAMRPYLCPLSCVLCPCHGTTGTVGTAKVDCGPFIDFMLERILETIRAIEHRGSKRTGGYYEK